MFGIKDRKTLIITGSIIAPGLVIAGSFFARSALIRERSDTANPDGRYIVSEGTDNGTMNVDSLDEICEIVGFEEKK